MLDPIAEMLTRIRNAQKAGHRDVLFPASNLKMAIVKIFEKEGFIESVSKEENGKIGNIKVRLKYYQVSNTQKLPAIKGLKKVSKEGQRIYVKSKNIKSVKNNFGVSIISTPKGIMTGFEARKNGLGGEVVCEIW